MPAGTRVHAAARERGWFGRSDREREIEFGVRGNDQRFGHAKMLSPEAEARFVIWSGFESR